MACRRVGVGAIDLHRQRRSERLKVKMLLEHFYFEILQMLKCPGLVKRSVARPARLSAVSGNLKRKLLAVHQFAFLGLCLKPHWGK
jgi:hypothetical protein